MSKKDTLLADFIRLRIEGLSFQAIAEKLNVAKQTLLEWNKELSVKEAIAEGRIFKTNDLLRAYEMDRQKRLEGLLQYRKRLNDELLARPLDDVPTHKLHEMITDATGHIKKEIGNGLQIGTNFNLIEWDTGDGFFHFNADE